MPFPARIKYMGHVPKWPLLAFLWVLHGSGVMAYILACGGGIPSLLICLAGTEFLLATGGIVSSFEA